MHQSRTSGLERKIGMDLTLVALLANPFGVAQLGGAG